MSLPLRCGGGGKDGRVYLLCPCWGRNQNTNGDLFGEGTGVGRRGRLVDLVGTWEGGGRGGVLNRGKGGWRRGTLFAYIVRFTNIFGPHCWENPDFNVNINVLRLFIVFGGLVGNSLRFVAFGFVWEFSCWYIVEALQLKAGKVKSEVFHPNEDETFYSFLKRFDDTAQQKTKKNQKKTVITRQWMGNL